VASASFMKDFEEFQFGWVILIILIPVQVLLSYFYFNQLDSNPISTAGFFTITFVSLSVWFLFYGLKTTISNNVLTVSFGIGIIRKRIKIESIKSARPTKNNHLYGWGIRLIPRGILYNISGSEAIELSLKKSHRIIRIGTQNTLKLQQEIVDRLVN
jgi:hypothetical protein